MFLSCALSCFIPNILRFCRSDNLIWIGNHLVMGWPPTTRCPSPHHSRPSKLHCGGHLCCRHISCLLFCATQQHTAPISPVAKTKSKTTRRLFFFFSNGKTQQFPLPVTTAHQTNLCCSNTHTHTCVPAERECAYSKLVSASRVRI